MDENISTTRRYDLDWLGVLAPAEHFASQAGPVATSSRSEQRVIAENWHSAQLDAPVAGVKAVLDAVEMSE